ncbi:hypothetical protein POM88_022856 [Heracleum sosnowskyi]|uniref:Pectinesterase catalytic domain-containing protein n=1 Tax=Heracleum sosnowskyi TaxID=360622 RepID=A0AAD8IHM8_9APIA|nr:hypothetical protein POM88_022856 [Heracleum sosnowskyi]
MIGHRINQTVITGNHSTADDFTTFNSATFAVVGLGFIAVTNTFRNTTGGANHQQKKKKWSGNFAADILYYAQFSNTGPGSDTSCSCRITWTAGPDITINRCCCLPSTFEAVFDLIFLRRVRLCPIKGIPSDPGGSRDVLSLLRLKNRKKKIGRIVKKRVVRNKVIAGVKEK